MRGWPAARIGELGAWCAVEPPLSWVQIGVKMRSNAWSVRRVARQHGFEKVMLKGCPSLIMHRPETVEAIRQLKAEGLSFKQIGEQLGMTKNQVIGLANRNGMLRSKTALPRYKPTVDPFPAPGRCVYPHGDVGEAGFGFCGERIAEFGAPYCEDHLRAAYIVQPERRVA